MHIYSVTDPEFRSYGSVLEGYDTDELLAGDAIRSSTVSSITATAR